MASGNWWLTEDEVAFQLGLSREAVRQLLEQGRIKGLCLSDGIWPDQIWRIPAYELDRILEEGLHEEWREELAAPDELEAGKGDGA